MKCLVITDSIEPVRRGAGRHEHPHRADRADVRAGDPEHLERHQRVVAVRDRYAGADLRRHVFALTGRCVQTTRSAAQGALRPIVPLVVIRATARWPSSPPGCGRRGCRPRCGTPDRNPSCVIFSALMSARVLVFWSRSHIEIDTMTEGGSMNGCAKADLVAAFARARCRSTSARHRQNPKTAPATPCAIPILPLLIRFITGPGRPACTMTFRRNQEQSTKKAPQMRGLPAICTPTDQCPAAVFSSTMSCDQLFRQRPCPRAAPWPPANAPRRSCRPAACRSVPRPASALFGQHRHARRGDLGKAAGHAIGLHALRATRAQDAGAQRGDGGRMPLHRRQVARRTGDLHLGRRKRGKPALRADTGRIAACLP